MRKTTRKTAATRRTNARKGKSRRTWTSRKARWTSRTHRRSGSTRRRTGASSKAWTKNARRSWPTSSPFAKAFIAGCRKGQPCWTVINTISQHTGKSFNTICTSLCKAGVCRGQKFNGEWICWPNFKTPTSSTWAKKSQWNMWQNFADWCIASGYCTPASLNKFSATTNQAWFMKSCQSIMTRQCTIIGATKVKAPTKAKIKTGTQTHANPWTAWQRKPLAWTRTFAFPTIKSFTRRYARAA